MLLNWNGWPDTEECLDSLVRSDHHPLAVTVVDNASTDDSVEGFGRWAGRLDPAAATRVPVDLIRTEENLGFAGGNNRGIRHALEQGAEYVLVLNNDTVVEPDTVSELVAVSESSGAAMVAPAIFDYARRDRVDRFGVVLTRSGSAYDRVSEDDGPLLCPSGCAGLYRRDLIDVLDRDPGGFFDEAFFLYSEDLDVGLRATARGYRTAFAPRSRIYHKGSASWGYGAPRAYYLRHRNTLWTIAKNYSAGLLVRESAYLMAGQLLGLLGALRRRRFRAVLKGKWHGLRDAHRMRRRADGPRTTTRDHLDRRFALLRRAQVEEARTLGAEARRLSGG